MKYRSFFLALMAMVMVSCQTMETDIVVSEDSKFSASVEGFGPQTRTSLTSDREVVWSVGDRVAIFQGSTSADEYLVSEQSAGKSNATFNIVSDNSDVNGSFSAGTEVPRNIALYPFVADLSVSGASLEDEEFAYNVTGFVLPAVQVYTENSFANGSFPMVAVTQNMSDHNLKFKNVLGAMKLQLKGTLTVKSIKITGGNNEKLSGAATITAYSNNLTPAITMTGAEDAAKSVTLDCGNSGVSLNESTATDFIIALPPVVFTQGFTVTVADDQEQTYTITASTPNTILRSSILVMPEISVGTSSGGENGTQNIDYIDEYGVNHGQGVEIGGVVWAPVNCGYHKDNFKYGKIYQWGRKYGQGHSGNLYDVNGDKVGTYSDSSYPSEDKLVVGPVALSAGNSGEKADVFFTVSSSGTYDWCNVQNDALWNAGTEDNPVKTEYDPCPEGWRVPTSAELDKLQTNKSPWTTNTDGQVGYWFSGSQAYSESVSRIFLPAAGYRSYYGSAGYRGSNGNYWSSKPYIFNVNDLFFNGGNASMSVNNRAYGYSVRCVQDNGELIPVSSLVLSGTSLSLIEGNTYSLSTTISPSNANHQSVHWWSDNKSVATVDQQGQITAVSAGTTTIIAMAGMQTATCQVTVKAVNIDYVDEYGVNHGRGTEIGGVVWAPVNCGYHKDDFKYGKLYQWGRKYGQGFSGSIHNISGLNKGTYSDSSYPSEDKIVAGPVALSEGNSDKNKDVFFKSPSGTYAYDWCNPQDGALWNSGTEDNPVKTEYDPCPKGWRVPTSAELVELQTNKSSWTTNTDGQIGYWFSGSQAYSESVSRIFLPAAGQRNKEGFACYRGYHGNYWSSAPHNYAASSLYLKSDKTGMSSNGMVRAFGYTVRCVQE